MKVIDRDILTILLITLLMLTGLAHGAEVEDFHPTKGQDFGPATNKIISRNTDPKTLKRLRPKIDEHNALYRDVQPCDRYALTYITIASSDTVLSDGDKVELVPVFGLE